MNKSDLTPVDSLESLHAELRALINSSRQRLSATVNAELSQLYWTVGRRLSTEVLAGERAEYGTQLINSLGAKLTQEFGRGFDGPNLRRMVQFAQTFSNSGIVVTLSRKLSWSHFLLLVTRSCTSNGSTGTSASLARRRPSV